jgi:hypothetical protein
MTEAIQKVPAETRWAVATKGLTAACTAILNALRGAVGDEKFNEFNGALWYEAGKGAKEFADTLGLTSKNSRQIEDVSELLAITSMGPEFTFEVVEATEDRCVGRATKCVWHERWKELGLDFEMCTVGHQGWGNGVVESLNPNFTFSITKNMTRGDSYCEWIIERKK